MVGLLEARDAETRRLDGDGAVVQRHLVAGVEVARHLYARDGAPSRPEDAAQVAGRVAGVVEEGHGLAQERPQHEAAEAAPEVQLHAPLVDEAVAWAGKA